MVALEVSARQFRDKQKSFFEIADSGRQIVIRRGKKQAYDSLWKGNSVTYSRRISANNRLIYDVYDDIVVVLILSAEGHYGDK